MNTFLVTRFSAMGDVAILSPVVTMVLNQNQSVRLVVVTIEPLFPLFEPHPRLILHPIKPKTTHKGIKGLWILTRELTRKYHFSAYIDVHDVLRTKILRFFFKLMNVTIICFDKGRSAKKALLKIRPPKHFLPHTSYRYAEAFSRAGLNISPELPIRIIKIPQPINLQLDEKAIAIAPFAKHKGKILATSVIENILQKLDQQSVKIYLMGGGNQEYQIIENWVKKYTNCINTVGKYDLYTELYLLSKMNVVLSMDSANMHLASLVGTPVISFWGATHPAAGFLGIHQSLSNVLQHNDLDCRPCSVFGTNTCKRGDWACLDFDATVILAKILPFFN